MELGLIIFIKKQRIKFNACEWILMSSCKQNKTHHSICGICELLTPLVVAEGPPDGPANSHLSV